MRRLLLVVTVALVMAAMVVATAAPAFATPAENTNENGALPDNKGVSGAAGNIGGHITHLQGHNAGQCKDINSGPFTTPKYSCKT